MRSCRIITGGKGEGKTSRALSYASGASGFVSLRDDHGYTLLSLATGEKRRLMSDAPLFPCRIGRWSYDQSVFDWACASLAQIYSGTVIIDEVGRLECEGGGFAPAIRNFEERNVDLIITVRRDFISLVTAAFRTGNAVIEEAESSL